MKKIRILHLRASNFVGGPERQVLRYAGYEQGGDAEVIVGTFAGESEGKSLLLEAEQRRLPNVGFPDQQPLRAADRLARYLQEQSISILCTHGYKATIVGLLARRHVPVAVVPFLRGWTAEDLRVQCYESLERRLLRYCDRIVCLSAAQRDRIGKDATLRSKLRIVNNVVEPLSISSDDRKSIRQQLVSRFQLPRDATVVASAGRLSPEKGTEFFLKAIPDIAARLPQVRFIVFGSGTRRDELGALAARLGIEHVVQFAGLVSDFPALLPGVDLLINPSLAEEMPNVVLEAMAAGVPVIATAVGGVPEIAAGRAACRMVPAGDSAAIASEALQLLVDPTSATALSKAGRDRVTAAYAPEHQRQQLRALYSDLLPWLKFEAFTKTSLQAPFISVVMPVRNEEKHIGETISALLDQDYPANRYEILVADGNSTDGTRAAVESIGANGRPSVRWLLNPRELASAGRNVGVRAACGDIITIIDGHCQIPGRHLLADTAQLMQSTSADALCRPQPLFHPRNSSFQNAVAQVRATALGHGRDSTIYSLDTTGLVDPTSSGATYRKEVFAKVGYFDESFDACEDVEFNHRVKMAGLQAFIAPSLAVFYRPRDTFRSLFRQLSRYGKGRYRFLWKHPGAFSVSQLVPAGLIVWLLLGWTMLLSTVTAPIFLLGSAFYALLLIIASLYLGMKAGWRTACLAPLIYLTIHCGLGWGFWQGAMEKVFGRRVARAGRNVETMSQKAN